MAGCEIVCLVPHPDRPAMLTAARAGLPTTVIEGDYDVPSVLAAIRAMLGTLPPVLRIDHRRSDDHGDPTLVVVDLEAIGAAAPDGFAWTAWAELASAAEDPDEVEPTDALAALPRWIERRERGPMPQDPPWSSAGWFDRASRWMVEQMADAGRAAIEPPRLVYTWGISVVLRARTAGGACYLKCSTPVFAHEAAVTQAIALITPDFVTRVIAVDADEHWLLMADHGDRALGDEAPERWVAGLEVHAQVQQAWTGRTAELTAAGAPVRPLAALADALPTFVASPVLAADLSEADRESWIAAVPTFVDVCRRLDDLPPSPTLVHGDFHPWNVAATDGGALIFDWTDAAVTHPFLDLAVYVTRSKDVGLRRSMRDAYLARWARVASPNELAEAADLGLVAGALYQVDSYIRLLAGLEPEDRGGLDGAAGSWARAALATLDEGIAVVRPGHADG